MLEGDGCAEHDCAYGGILFPHITMKGMSSFGASLMLQVKEQKRIGGGNKTKIREKSKDSEK